MELTVMVCVGIGVLLFVCFVVGYREGLRLGMRSARGVEPKPIKSPVKAVKEHIEAKEAEQEAKAEADVLEKIMSYDGYTERERAWMKGVGK